MGASNLFDTGACLSALAYREDPSSTSLSEIAVRPRRLTVDPLGAKTLFVEWYSKFEKLNISLENREAAEHKIWKCIAEWVAVHEGKELDSTRSPERLMNGAVVWQCELDGNRLKYKLIDGTGPAEGWISIDFGKWNMMTKLQHWLW